MNENCGFGKSSCTLFGIARPEIDAAHSVDIAQFGFDQGRALALQLGLQRRIIKTRCI
jgi:hypothetical protein